jgi:hypothetical protein
MCRSLECSVNSGAISSLSQWTHLSPKLEGRAEAIVAMGNFLPVSLAISRRSNRVMAANACELP